jgi:hypothetical protein
MKRFPEKHHRVIKLKQFRKAKAERRRQTLEKRGPAVTSSKRLGAVRKAADKLSDPNRLLVLKGDV